MLYFYCAYLDTLLFIYIFIELWQFPKNFRRWREMVELNQKFIGDAQITHSGLWDRKQQIFIDYTHARMHTHIYAFIYYLVHIFQLLNISARACYKCFSNVEFKLLSHLKYHYCFFIWYSVVEIFNCPLRYFICFVCIYLEVNIVIIFAVFRMFLYLLRKSQSCFLKHYK